MLRVLRQCLKLTFPLLRSGVSCLLFVQACTFKFPSLNQSNSKTVAATPWAHFLAQEEDTISSTSICLSLDDLSGDQIKEMTGLLENEDVAVDIGAYRDAPDG